MDALLGGRADGGRRGDGAGRRSILGHDAAAARPRAAEWDT
ncbi:hypothetical protein SAMN04488543_1328 [Friedmanniella luteola]|uniref:Uncharacterized protein n=1 Tax=Friedmanniella luteola TaxID=546871 RepID=A0A1H1QI52_9ACTN|nr:hypothetical protein SAMN04488543_1328 [Friedmanniella luteola]